MTLSIRARYRKIFFGSKGPHNNCLSLKSCICEKLFLSILPGHREAKGKGKCASSGNRTRAARVAGEHSTTEPTMLVHSKGQGNTFQKAFFDISRYRVKPQKVCLPDGESNPGLPRDRRGYLPLYYRGLAVAWSVSLQGTFFSTTKTRSKSHQISKETHRSSLPYPLYPFSDLLMYFLLSL